jgi:hypothetical protein
MELMVMAPVFGDAVGNMGSLGANTFVHGNSLMNNDGPTRVEHTVDDETNAIIINHNEYIQDIVPTQSGFQTQTFLAINPGLGLTFPWLSNVASFYEEYKMIQLIYTFKSMVTEGNATAGGTIIMAAQYNPGSPPFNNKQTMENYDYASSVKVTHDLKFGIECDHSKNAGTEMMYCRTGAVPAGQDIKTYDLCTLQVATTGAVSGQLLGELWCYYKIKLAKSKIPLPGSSEAPNTAAAVFTLGVSRNPIYTPATFGLLNGFGTAVDNTNAFILSTYVATPDSDSCGYNYSSITFPSYITGGNYIINLTLSVSSTGANGWNTLAVQVGHWGSNGPFNYGPMTDGVTYLPAQSSGIDKVLIKSPALLFDPVQGSNTVPLGYIWNVVMYIRINSPSNQAAVFSFLNNTNTATPNADATQPNGNFMGITQVALNTASFT